MAILFFVILFPILEYKFRLSSNCYAPIVLVYILSLFPIQADEWHTNDATSAG